MRCEQWPTCLLCYASQGGSIRGLRSRADRGAQQLLLYVGWKRREVDGQLIEAKSALRLLAADPHRTGESVSLMDVRKRLREYDELGEALSAVLAWMWKIAVRVVDSGSSRDASVRRCGLFGLVLVSVPDLRSSGLASAALWCAPSTVYVLFWTTRACATAEP